MKFRALQENLRKALWERIEEGELTGLGLAGTRAFGRRIFLTSLTASAV
jgi:hypothetical protein